MTRKKEKCPKCKRLVEIYEYPDKRVWTAHMNQNGVFCEQGGKVR
jgi:phage FluMu protein Com